MNSFLKDKKYYYFRLLIVSVLLGSFFDFLRGVTSAWDIAAVSLIIFVVSVVATTFANVFVDKKNNDYTDHS